MLVVMYKAESNEYIKERYRNEIENFDRAIEVQDALNIFKLKNLRYPETLTELVPDYLKALPVFNYRYSLDWQSPVLKLVPPKL